jgi:hypothetical protein
MTMNQFPRALCLMLLALGTFSCAEMPEEPIDSTTAALAGWVRGNYSHALRVNAGETNVRSVCELTIPLGSPKLLVVTASESGGASSAGPLVWTGAAVTGSGLTVTGCSGYPCEVTAQWHKVSGNGTTLGCQIIADDGTSRMVGGSTGMALTVSSAPAAPVIFNQDVTWSSHTVAVSDRATTYDALRRPGARTNVPVAELRLSKGGPLSGRDSPGVRASAVFFA